MNAVASMPHWMFTMNYKFGRVERIAKIYLEKMNGLAILIITF